MAHLSAPQNTKGFTRHISWRSLWPGLVANLAPRILSPAVFVKPLLPGFIIILIIIMGINALSDNLPKAVPNVWGRSHHCLLSPWLTYIPKLTLFCVIYFGVSGRSQRNLNNSSPGNRNYFLPKGKILVLCVGFSLKALVCFCLLVGKRA